MSASSRLGRAAAGATALLAAIACAPASAQTAPPTLDAGIGRADITPPTGYFMMGWVRSDARSTGQHVRLYARAIVLQQGARKVALVAEDLNGIAGGMLAAAAALDSDIGFSQSNVLDSASHTHSAPSGFYNFPTYNTVFPTLRSLTSANFTGALDPQLYAFEVRQLALAIRRANANLGPARAGWGATQLVGVTQNRSLEAHLANFGIVEAPGSGNVSQDPLGYLGTIDPNVEVLRVDKLMAAGTACGSGQRAHRRQRRRRAGRSRRTRLSSTGARPQCRAVGRWTPVGMWSTFANHGTVNKTTFHFYNADHHGQATRLVEAEIRRLGAVPAGQDVVNAYGNADEGDQTAGIQHSGPADAQWVGAAEARAFMDAWRQAGTNMTDTPQLDWRWTRICFCGQSTADGIVASDPVFGLAEVTGSEENRGPLQDVTGQTSLEGSALPADAGPQGDKIAFLPGSAHVPSAVPMMALRIADRMLVSIPGELTVGMGTRVRAAVMAATSGFGIAHVVIAGIANEYLSYFTTPEEYERQHFEGANTLYGKTAALVLEGTLTDLASRLVLREPSPTPYDYDPTNGVPADAAAFPGGADRASATAQPQTTARLAHASFHWSGGARGFDRPVDGAFVHVRRQVGGGWQDVTDDLGLQILWTVDDNGNYTATWEVPLDAATGTYDFQITANHYTLVSDPFRVLPSTALAVSGARTAEGHARLQLEYPHAVENTDITYRPAAADGGSVTAQVRSAQRTVRQQGGDTFDVPAAATDTVNVAPGAFSDRYGNSNSGAFTLYGS